MGIKELLEDKKIVEFVEKNFAGLDPRDNTFWGHDTNIGTKDEIIKVVKDFILEQAIAEIKELQSQQLKVEVSESEKIVRGTPRADCQIREGKLESHDASALEQIPSDISNLLQKQRQEILDKIDSFINYANQEKKDNYLWYKIQLENLKQQVTNQSPLSEQQQKKSELRPESMKNVPIGKGDGAIPSGDIQIQTNCPLGETVKDFNNLNNTSTNLNLNKGCGE